MNNLKETSRSMKILPCEEEPKEITAVRRIFKAKKIRKKRYETAPFPKKGCKNLNHYQKKHNINRNKKKDAPYC